MNRRLRNVAIVLGVVGAATVVAGTIIDLTMADLHLRGTQAGSVPTGMVLTSQNCNVCHSGFSVENDPMSTWSGSLMAQAGRDPLFFAQMSLANQDAGNAGYFCMRCHVPMSFVSGNAMPADGSALTAADKDGVTCHFCHSMVDPIYRPGESPTADLAILNALPGGPPEYYGNAQFVLDPTGTRRGPLTDAMAPHDTHASGFFRSSNMCGTCHEVGNIAVSKQPDGTYRYNAMNQATPDENPAMQFPLERTFSEWRLSAFAAGGVDMQGRFGGNGPTVVSTCQDCHMPKATTNVCVYTPERPGMGRHEFAGAGAQVIDLISAFTAGDPAVDQAALARGRAASVSMLERAASVETTQTGGQLNVRVINETGHKLPTGHIEGRRVWINVRYLNAQGTLMAERGHYDLLQAELHHDDTTVFEMHVGISDFASGVTGLAAGRTGHMVMADTIVKDNRIPPRGFNNEAFAAAGAPVVAAEYADGQHWADRAYSIPAGAASAEVRVYYQNTPKEYILELRDNNHTDNWGQTLYNLWNQTGRGAPIEMASKSINLTTFCASDFNRSGSTTIQDLFDFLGAFFGQDPLADINSNGLISVQDVFDYLAAYFSGCV
ncbi:MAG: hypothetical protein IT438_14060 [Phycisphaerales bacterium]|nr:hypothetical protein [Phycisphaerales bacterium]